jgi:DNA-binding NtrC family response regulator
MPLSNKNLILADDEATTQNIIKQILFMLNCSEFEICSNIEIAINKFEENHYDFLILDMTFPSGKNGLDLIQYLHEKKVSIPVLVFSANIEDYRLELFKYSNSSLTIKLLEKPSDLAGITEAIKDCIELHSCKHVKNVQIPALETSINSLQEQLKEIQEITFKNVVPKLILDGLIENKERIFAGAFIVAGALFAYYRNLLGI